MATGIVTNVASRQVNTKFGPKAAYDIFIDNQKYGAGFKKPMVTGGDVVEFEFKTTQYGNEITSIRATGTQTTLPPVSAGNSGSFVKAAASPSYGGKGVFPIPLLDGQRAIVRQNALTNSRELVAGLIIAAGNASTGGTWSDRQTQLDILSDEIIRIARKFEAYSCGDLDREEAEKEIGK